MQINNVISGRNIFLVKLSVVCSPCHWQPVQFTTASDNVFTQRSWSSLTFRVLFDPLTRPNCSMLPRERRQRGDIPLLIPLSLTLCPGRNSLWQPQLGSVAAATTRHISTQTERETVAGEREVQGWWLKFMCHPLIWCERAQHTHTYTQDRGKRKGQRSRSVSLWCAVSICMCVSEWQWSSGVCLMLPTAVHSYCTSYCHGAYAYQIWQFTPWTYSMQVRKLFE